MKKDKNCLSSWFPLLQQAGLPVPTTHFTVLDEGVPGELLDACDRDTSIEKCSPRIQSFVKWLSDSCKFFQDDRAFLRTGHTSGKHDYVNTCCLRWPYTPLDVFNHVKHLVRYSESCGVVGFPCDVWAVRKFLNEASELVFTAFNGTPIRREFRVFTEGDAVLCMHPYWPADSVESTVSPLDRDDWKPILKEISKIRPSEAAHLIELARSASFALEPLGDRWSIDFLETNIGWFITDVADADQSFHYPGCLKFTYKNKTTPQ